MLSRPTGHPTSRPTLVPSRFPSLPAPRSSWLPAPAAPPSDDRETARPSAALATPFALSVHSVTSWAGFLAILVLVALSMFAAGWASRGSR
jgi:hypothetical protein